MRRHALLAVPALAACVGAAALVARASGLAAAPGGFGIQHVRVDPRCNGGRGVLVPTAPVSKQPAGRLSQAVSGMLADGSSLTAITTVYPARRSVVLRSITSDCVPDGSFGDRGTATLSIPPVAQPGNAGAGFPPDGVWVDVVAARSGGGAILAGAYGGGWVVGEVTAAGRLDAAFGDGGWDVLPFRGEVTAVLEEASGRIVIGGDDGGGCCTRTWAAALSADGTLDKGFGTKGREELPTGEDSGVHSLDLEPNGDILAQVSYGNMGCWGMELAMLDPSGRPVPQFERRLQRFWRGLDLGAFVGDVVVDGDGFRIVGSGQRSCYGGPQPAAHPAGLIAGFGPDGRQLGVVHRFASPMYGTIDAFADGDDVLVFATPYDDRTRLAVTARRPDGSLDTGFGSRGRGQIRGPWRGRDAALETDIWIGSDRPGSIVVVASSSQHDRARLIRLVG